MPGSRKELPMEENGKRVSRARVLLSKENRGGMEEGEISFRVYYGQTGAAVPFMWESQPGTPKHPIFNNSNDAIVPPLTPPPSYKTSSSALATSPREDRRSRILFMAFLSSITRRSRSHVTPTSTLSSSSYSDPLSCSTSSSSSSSLPPSSPRCIGRKKHKDLKRNFLLCSSPTTKKFSLFDDIEQDREADGSPTNSAIMCFGFKKKGVTLWT